MLYLKRPENQRIRHWLDEQAAQPLSYSQVGMTSSELMPGGYHHINHEVCIGQGRRAFQAAKEALENNEAIGQIFERSAEVSSGFPLERKTRE